jgi:hypothetical protein
MLCARCAGVCWGFLHARAVLGVCWGGPACTFTVSTDLANYGQHTLCTPESAQTVRTRVSTGTSFVPRAAVGQSMRSAQVPDCMLACPTLAGWTKQLEPGFGGCSGVVVGLWQDTSLVRAPAHAPCMVCWDQLRAERECWAENAALVLSPAAAAKTRTLQHRGQISQSMQALGGEGARDLACPQRMLSGS